MHRRSKDPIIAQILECCKDGARITRIVHDSNMNFRSIRPYMVVLAKNGLIEIVNESPTIYRTTKRGLEALSHLNAIREMISN